MGWRAVETDIILSVENIIQGVDVREAVAEFAAAKRDEVIASDHPSSVDTFVDGVRNAALRAVKIPDGVIRFEFGYLREVVAEVFNMLINASPYSPKRPNASILTHYKDVHLVFVNGVETDDITNLAASDVVKFANVQPYARKIEQGLSLQAPTGVYQMVAQRASRSNLGKVASISFTYDIFPYAGPKSATGKRSNIDSKNRRDDRFPTITVKSRY